MLLTLTWCHCNPADAPTRSCGTAISSEEKVDDIASAYDGGRQGGAHTLASNQNAAIRGGAAALLHQSCPVPIRDCQVVGAITGRRRVNVKCSEL